MTAPARRLAAVVAGWLTAVGCGAASGGRAEAAGPPPPAAPPESVTVTLFLVGDAGEPDPAGDPVLTALRREAAAAPNAVIVFLGDNVYPRGMPDSGNADRAEAERRLDAQLEVARAAGARALLIPGNHDWDRHGEQGWSAVRRQERYVAASGGGAAMLPGGGCPGPAVVDLGTVLRVVLLDTQWWLHERAKPRHPDSSCPADSETEVLDSLRAALRGAAGRPVAVAAHHPLESGGHHGGHFGWREHVFPLRGLKKWLWLPLPVLGSAYPLARQTGVTNQDVSGPRYRRMREVLEAVFAESPPLVYAAGHEHNLQVLAGRGARYQVVSGAGFYGHLSPVTWLDSTRFAAARSGYMRVEVLRDRRVRLAVRVVDASGGSTEGFGLWLR